MKVQDVIRQKGGQIVSVGGEDTVFSAVNLLNTHRIGALIVMDAGGEVSGLLTERDILRHLSESGGGLGDCRVADIMTPKNKLVIATPDDSVDYAMGAMTRNHVRHLPVVDKGAVAGLISIGDVIKILLSDKEHENKMMAEYISGTSYPC